MNTGKMLEKLREYFSADDISMIDFWGQFQLMVRRYFEPGKIYDLYGFCFAKRTGEPDGESEILQFLDEKLDLIEEIVLERSEADQKRVEEFLSFGQNPTHHEPEVSLLMQDVFDRILNVNKPEVIGRRSRGIAKILLESDPKTDHYNDRPDIPLFEESEDGYQRVQPFSSAFTTNDDISVKTPFTEGADLFSEIGLSRDEEPEEEKKPDFISDEEDSAVFTHTSLIVDDDSDDEDEFTVFDGGIGVVLPKEPENLQQSAKEPFGEEFIENLVSVSGAHPGSDPDENIVQDQDEPGQSGGTEVPGGADAEDKDNDTREQSTRPEVRGSYEADDTTKIVEVRASENSSFGEQREESVYLTEETVLEAGDTQEDSDGTAGIASSIRETVSESGDIQENFNIKTPAADFGKSSVESTQEKNISDTANDGGFVAPVQKKRASIFDDFFEDEETSLIAESSLTEENESPVTGKDESSLDGEAESSLTEAVEPSLTEATDSSVVEAIGSSLTESTESSFVEESTSYSSGELETEASQRLNIELSDEVQREELSSTELPEQREQTSPDKLSVPQIQSEQAEPREQQIQSEQAEPREQQIQSEQAEPSVQTTDADTEQYLSAEQEKITEFVESNSVETDGTSDQSFLSNELPFNENMFDDLIPEQLGDTIPSSTEVSAVSDTEEPTPSEASAVSAMEEPKPPGGETVSDTEEPTQSEASTVVTAEVPTPSDSDINAPAETILPTTVATGEDKEEASGVYQETEEETLPASLSEERSVNESDKSEPEKPTGFMPHFSHEGLGETEFPEVSATFQNRQDISDANPQESSNRERQGLSITEPQGSSNGVRRELHKEDLQRPSEAEGNNLSKVNPEWETTMSRKDKNSKGALSVLLKMMFLFFLIVATWFVLDSTGLLKGKTAVIKEENFAKGAKVIEDKNSPADKRVYPFNRDTQFEGYLKGSELKTGEYYEIAENGVLTAVPYDPAADKSMKVEVPPDSLIVENKKNKKQEDKQTEAENKAKDDKSGKNAKNDKKDEKPKKGDDQKPAAGGNITLQDAVKNKVNETKIADYVFKQGKNYFVQVSAHRAYKTAEKLAADLKKKGYKAFVMKINKEGVKGEEGIWYRVRIGPFDNQEKALSVNKEFQNKTKKK